MVGVGGLVARTDREAMVSHVETVGAMPLSLGVIAGSILGFMQVLRC